MISLQGMWLFGVFWGGCSPADLIESIPQECQEQVVLDDDLFWLVSPSDRDMLVSRVAREPYQTLWSQIQITAEEEYVDINAWEWDVGEVGANAQIAKSAALVGWLENDQNMQEKAKQFLLTFPTHFDTYTDWDINIRMVHPLIAAIDAREILRASRVWSTSEDQEFRDRIAQVTEDFFETFLLDDIHRQAVLGFAQNNHPIRTMVAIGYVALAFPALEEAMEWRNYTLSELGYLWSEQGQYIQADGGVSEGPFYFNFAFGASVAFFLAANKALPSPFCFRQRCANRQEVDPWVGHGCVEDLPVPWENPLEGAWLYRAMDWSINLRMPGGDRFPVADSRFTSLNGVALLSQFSGEPHHQWDWENISSDPLATTWGADLTLHYLLHYDDLLQSEEPPWQNWIMEEAGFAAFRSGWGSDEVFATLIAEQGAMRKTLHDHVDGLAFGLAAYGDYLLMDTGYYKGGELELPQTAQADAHNVILIDGEGAPNKGLLHDFGDTDATLSPVSSFEEAPLVMALAQETYAQTDFSRLMGFVRNRYFFMVDHLETSSTIERLHSWRVHPYVGEEVGGSLELADNGFTLERDAGAVRLWIASTEGSITWTEPEFSSLQAPHVHKVERSGGPAHHTVIDGEVEGVSPHFLSLLIPYRVGAEPTEVVFLEAGENGVAWMVMNEEGEDIFWLRGNNAPQQLFLPDGSQKNLSHQFGFWGAEGGRFIHNFSKE